MIIVRNLRGHCVDGCPFLFVVINSLSKSPLTNPYGMVYFHNLDRVSGNYDANINEPGHQGCSRSLAREILDLFHYSNKMENTMAVQPVNKSIVNDAIIKNISDSIHGLSYGTVTITVHNARIVQIEISQKSRFDDVWTVQEGGGI